MITNAILYFLYGAVYLLTAPLRLLADVSINSSVITAVSTANNYIKPLDAILPLSALFSVFGLMLSIEVGLMVYKIIMWGLKRLPTQS